MGAGKSPDIPHELTRMRLIIRMYVFHVINFNNVLNKKQKELKMDLHLPSTCNMMETCHPCTCWVVHAGLTQDVYTRGQPYKTLRITGLLLVPSSCPQAVP